MQKQDFSPELDREVYQAFKRIFITSKDPVSANDLYGQIAQMPASRFFVSDEAAHRNVSRLARDLGATVMSPLRKAMYTEIAFRALERHRQTGKPLKKCVSEVILEPAPSYYLTPETIKYKIFNYRKQLRAQKAAR